MSALRTPYVLSLSKDFPTPGSQEGQGFDKLSPNGCGDAL